MKKNFLGKQEAYSSISGLVDRLEEATGRLIVKQEDGEVDEVELNDQGKQPEAEEKETEEKEEKKAKEKTGKVKVKSKIRGVFGLGKAKGELVVLEEPFCLEELTAEAKGKIIFAPCLESRGALFKADALDVAGLILGRMRRGTAKKLEQFRQDLDLALLVLTFSRNKKLSLKNFKHKKVLLKGEEKRLVVLKNK